MPLWQFCLTRADPYTEQAMFEYPKIHEIRSASDVVHPASTPENPITAAYVLVIRDRNPEGYIGDEFLDWNYILWWRRNYALNRELCLALRTETLVLRNSAENMFLGYRSEKALEWKCCNFAGSP